MHLSFSLGFPGRTAILAKESEAELFTTDNIIRTPRKNNRIRPSYRLNDPLTRVK